MSLLLIVSLALLKEGIYALSFGSWEMLQYHNDIQRFEAQAGSHCVYLLVSACSACIRASICLCVCVCLKVCTRVLGFCCCFFFTFSYGHLLSEVVPLSTMRTRTAQRQEKHSETA